MNKDLIVLRHFTPEDIEPEYIVNIKAILTGSDRGGSDNNTHILGEIELKHKNRNYELTKIEGDGGNLEGELPYITEWERDPSAEYYSLRIYWYSTDDLAFEALNFLILTFGPPYGVKPEPENVSITVSRKNRHHHRYSITREKRSYGTKPESRKEAVDLLLEELPFDLSLLIAEINLLFQENP